MIIHDFTRGPGQLWLNRFHVGVSLLFVIVTFPIMGLIHRGVLVLEERPGAVQLLEQIASMRSQLTSRSDYSTLMDTVASAFASSTLWISLLCLITTKNKFSGTGLFGVLPTAVPVQFGLTV
jgi:hypothetical protein